MDIKLNAKTILEKEFKSGLRGYHQEDVDLFLDDVIADYQAFAKKIETLEDELEKAKQQLADKEKQFEEMKRRPAQAPITPSGTNVDILKRLSNLERHVFGNKLND